VENHAGANSTIFPQAEPGSNLEQYSLTFEDGTDRLSETSVKSTIRSCEISQKSAHMEYDDFLKIHVSPLP
jgi:hypothetical protein